MQLRTEPTRRHPRWSPHLARTCAATALLVALALSSAGAQDGPSSGASDGPIGESGRPVSEDAGTVRDRTTRGMLSGPNRGSAGTVGESSLRGMLSGPVSELTVGPATAGRGMSGNGSLEPSSVGAVREKAPLRVERPLTDEDIGRLEEALRQVEPLDE